MSEAPPSNGPVLLRIEAEPQAGSWNMATDQYLLESALSNGMKAVRMYRWKEPTVSLGYFQDSHDEALRTTFRKLAAVRRLSGGGAILHHQELTYSFSLPPSDPLTREPTELYGRVHSAIINVLRDFGADCIMRGEDDAQPEEPFLCFVRSDRHDIHCAGHKVVGSAQRRRKGAVLQHGSIILRRSPHAPEIPGLCDLAETFTTRISTPSQISSLALKLGNAIAGSLGKFREISDWPDKATVRIANLEESSYSTLERPRHH